MRNIFKKMTKNNEHNRDCVLCHPRECGVSSEEFPSARTETVESSRDQEIFQQKNILDPGLNSKFFRLDSCLCRNDKGFTILFAVIVSTLVLALGMGIVAITMKEIQLSGAGKDSQLAFYAADSGSECALYYDSKGDFFATSSESVQNPPIICNGSSTVPALLGTPTPTTATSTFRMYMKYDVGMVPDKDKPCVDVTVSKQPDANGSTTTSIDARGYNTCEESHPRRLERGYRLDY